MPKPNSFDVMKTMAARNGKIMLVPLGNVTEARKVKAGCHITIGAPEQVMTGIALGQYYGGLLLADKDEFERVQKELEAAEPVAEGGQHA